MDVLDPLGTVDAVAPHTTSFSSNIYLLKKQTKSLVKGQLLSLKAELSPGDEDKLWFVVGKEIDPKNATFEYKDSTLGRIYGFSLTFIDGKATLLEDENEVTFGRVYIINENSILDGEKVSDWNGFEVWTKFVKEAGSKEEEEGLWNIVEDQFGKSRELAYYWYLRTGKFYGEVTYSPAEQEEINALENLDIPSLLKPKDSPS